MKIKKIIRLVAILLLTITIINVLRLDVEARTFSVDKADLYSKGVCKSLLKNKETGGTIKVTKVYYKNGGKEYPAYCLNRDLDGVEKGDGYTVTVSKLVDNELVRNVIINGYPYKSLESLGVNSVDEAFVATKMSVYTVLYDYPDDKFVAIGDAGKRTLAAMKKILKAAKSSKSSQLDATIDFEEESTTWEVDKKDKQYLSKNFKVKSDAEVSEFSLKIEDNTIDGIKITDIENNEKSTFKNTDEFKILIPISEIKEEGKFKIKIDANVETKPILYGKAPNSKVQNYALTGISYEVGINEKEAEYPKNGTTIIVEKIDGETGDYLSNATFNIYDENKKLIYANIKTDENGLITINNVFPGKYYIEEVKAPDCYEKLNNLTEFTVSYNEELTVTIENNRIKLKDIEEPKRPEKPKEETTPKKVVVKERKLPVTGM